jgi:hypothetical protein
MSEHKNTAQSATNTQGGKEMDDDTVKVPQNEEFVKCPVDWILILNTLVDNLNLLSDRLGCAVNIDSTCASNITHSCGVHCTLDNYPVHIVMEADNG